MPGTHRLLLVVTHVLCGLAKANPVVTHGAGQFALTRAGTEAGPAPHGAVRLPVQAEAIPAHVCGTHASRFDVGTEGVPDYVDVAASAPARIRAYRELGDELVLVSRPG